MSNSRWTPQEFWRWTEKHLSELRQFDQDPAQAILDKAADILHRYDPSLGLEVSISSSGILDMTITAHGSQESFQSVKTLVEASPTIHGLKVVAFRQPEGPNFRLTIHGHVFSPKDVRFEPMKGRFEPRSVGLMIFFPSADDIPVAERRHIAQIMLQAILGEYQAATRIDHVEVANSAGVNLDQYIPLSEVAAYLSWFEQRNSPTYQ